MSENTLISAMVAAMGELTNPPKNAKNPHFKSKYATLEDIIKHTRPVLAKYDLAISMPAVYEEGGAGVRTIIWHGASNTKEEYDSFILPVDRKNAQAVGSALTYARRYMLCSILNIAGDEDDDGNAATQAEPKPNKEMMTEAQKKELAQAAKNDFDLIKRVLKENGYESSNHVPKDSFESLRTLIELEVASEENSLPFM